MASKAIRTIRAALKPPSSGRKLAKRTRVSQPTLCQLANEIHPAGPATKKKLNKALGLCDEDWL